MSPSCTRSPTDFKSVPNLLPRIHSQHTGSNEMIFRQGSASGEGVLPAGRGGDVAPGAAPAGRPAATSRGSRTLASISRRTRTHQRASQRGRRVPNQGSSRL